MDWNNNIYKYEIKSKIGGGSFAKVYHGFNKEKNLDVAVKYIDLTIIKDDKSKNYMFQEVEIMKCLNHPNIVQLYESYIINNQIYLIMEYCSEGDLAKYLKNQPNNRINEIQARNFIHQLIDGIGYLHSNNIIHRDLKPVNILISNNVLKLADFGFAKELKDENELLVSFCGTPLYMPPEFFQGKKYTMKADMWSLGLIIHEMVVGYHPFDVKTIVQLEQAINKNWKFESNYYVSKDFISLVTGLIQKDPNKRFSLDQVRNHRFLYECPPSDNILNEIQEFHIVDNHPPVNKTKMLSTFTIIENWKGNDLFNSWV